MLLPIHIVAGGLAIILGAAALLAPKGGTLHRRSGLLFVYAMLTMGLSGSVLALRQSLTNANVLGGLMSAYFVVTALTTVRPVSAWTRRLNAGALVLAIALALVEIALGYKAFASPRGTINGVPFFMLFFLATITTIALIGDVRVMQSGMLRGGRRLARHLWRMCFALFIAAGSFFSIRARVARILPAPFTTPAMRALPIVLVFVAMFYWLWRVRARRPLVLARST
jgi:uncharacterized membrane protein